MIADLLDITSSKWRKSFGALFVIGSILALFAWASHERRAMERDALRKKQAEQARFQKRSQRIRQHLIQQKRGFLLLSFATQKRKMLVWKRFPIHKGFLQLHQQGLVYTFGTKSRKRRYIADLEGNGLTQHDHIGHTKWHKRRLLPPRTVPWSTLSVYRQRKLKRAFRDAHLSAMRALHKDQQHLNHIKQLTNIPAFAFHVKTNTSRWKVWRKRSMRIVIQPQPQPLAPSPTTRPAHTPTHHPGLVVIYKQTRRGFQCKRPLLTPWKQTCAGTELVQHLFIDRGAPGLNPRDNDQHGIRILRRGKVHKTSRIDAFGTLPLQTQLLLRLRYKQWIQLAIQHLASNTPKLRPNRTKKTRQPRQKRDAKQK